MDEYRENAKKVKKALEQDAAFIEPNPFLAQRVLGMAHGATNGGLKVKRKVSAGLVLALVMLMSAVVALACNYSYVIRFLSDRIEDAGQAQRMEGMVQPLGMEFSSTTATCTIEDAYFDGKTLALGIGIQTERPVYLSGTEVQVNGGWIDYAENGGSIEDMWAGNSPYPQVDAAEQIHGIEYTFMEPLPKGETANVTLRMTLLVPQNGVAEVDIYQEDHEAMWAQIDAAYEAGLTPISADEPHEVLIPSVWHDTLDKTQGYQGPLNDVDSLERYANMEEMYTLKATFMLEAK